jgi:alpha/beta superfamily hydrolase
VERRVSFKSNGLVLEGILHVPVGTNVVPGVVVCHPHPLYGGSMYNAIVEGLCKGLERSGLVALRFNFRGVGASEGSYDRGVGEVRDARAALSFLRSISSPRVAKLGITGYSFGAYVAARATTEDPNIEALALISPPLTLYDFDFLKAVRVPKLVVLGDRDEFAGASIKKVTKMDVDRAKLFLVEGADHFWLGYEDEVCTAVVNFFKEAFKLKP